MDAFGSREPLVGEYEQFTRSFAYAEHYLTFDSPSYRSSMMVLRDCVRRHHRVPQILVCDQGSDFMSTYFEMLLPMIGTTKRERRAGKPRTGSVCERIFNTSQEQFVSR